MMASPTIETFCCMASDIAPKVLTQLQFNSKPYNIVCILSSFMGIIGGLYQILPSAPSPFLNRHQNVGYTQKIIIKWLAFSDILAASGILLRSIFWMWKGDIVRLHNQENDRDMIICALFSLWIRFFYTSTYFWTLCYAIDVYRVSKQKIGNLTIYHSLTWIISFILTLSGLGTLYLPNFECHSGMKRVLPNYLLSYIPIVFIMIINPLLYYIASKNVHVLLVGGLGQLTCTEHTLLAALKEKFFCIVLVFYVCWFPNVLNGIILWGFWHNIPQYLLIAVWYMMAIVNPLQAVLNSLVYKGWENCGSFWKDLKLLLCQCKSKPYTDNLLEESSTEYRMSSADERPSFSTRTILLD